MDTTFPICSSNWSGGGAVTGKGAFLSAISSILNLTAPSIWELKELMT